MGSPSSPDWRQHLQIVFSVLVGVAFAQAFRFAANAQLGVSRFLLVGTVFYVVLDCWYNLNFELVHFHASKWWDVALYLVALLTYSCLPFLYFAQTTGPKAKPGDLGMPELLMANLAAICVADAVRRTIIVGRTRQQVRSGITDPKTLTGEERRRIGKDFFYMFSGYAWGLTLGLLVWLLYSEHASGVVWAAAILLVWLGLRVMDHFVVRNVAETFAALVAPEPSQEGT